VSKTNQDNLAKDGIVDYFQVDSTMDPEEFRNFYRAGVWFETPVAQNYNARHSIHERRMIHQRKILLIPLDILPFGYSIGSSLPSASLSGECGFLKITLYPDWLDRSFYLTRVSDIPSLHPLVNHLHYNTGDIHSNGDIIGASGTDLREGWVSDRSLGRFGDPTFKRKNADDGDTKNKYAQGEGNVLNTHDYVREGIIPTTYDYSTENTAYRITNNKYIPVGASAFVRGGEFGKYVVKTSTSATATRNEVLDTDLLVYRLGLVDDAYYREISGDISLKLLQVGYQTLPCIRELLSKLPNIYITTEWVDHTENINITKVDINNDLYIQALILWFMPLDKQGVESMRMYPCHFMDHELPVISGLQLTNEQSQGTTIYDWNMLNVFNPANMRLNPLLENIGLISFSPTLSANTFPLAYYDSNINGYLKLEFKQGETGTNSITNPINMKYGNYRIISIGINGVANVNLNLFRLIF
jgi:hypothetical protein